MATRKEGDNQKLGHMLRQMRGALGLALCAVTLLVGGCIGDHFPSIAVNVENQRDDSVIAVLAAGTVDVAYTPRPEVHAYVLKAGASGWTDFVLLAGDTGSISVYTSDCVLLDRASVTDGVHTASISRDGKLDLGPAGPYSGADKPPMDRFGDSCGVAAGYLSIPTGPLPTDGPSPPGDPVAQERDALASIGLKPTSDVAFTAPARLRWLPEFTVLEAMSIQNDSGATVEIPWDPTVAKWDGSTWIRQPCPTFDGRHAPDERLCALDRDGLEIDTGYLESGQSGQLLDDWPGREIEPGTYAVMLPLVQRALSVAGATFGVCAIVTVTANP